MFRVMDSLQIRIENKPTKSNPDGKVYVMKNKILKHALGKGRVRSVSKAAIERIKDEVVCGVCMITAERMEKLKKKLIF